MTSAVHQVVAGAAPRDAITNHVLASQEVIRAMGLRSEVFVDDAHVALELAGQVIPYREWSRRTEHGDAAVLHYSIDSPAFSHVMGLVGRRSAIYYHNVTPPELLWTDAPGLATTCRNGRATLAAFAGRVSIAAAASEFNARELSALGFPSPRVVGILRPDFHRAPEPRVRRRVSAHDLSLLFVGRGVPNKGQWDLILTLAALVDAGVDAELRLVGHWGGNRPYFERCTDLVSRLGLEHRVSFLHSVSDDHLAEEYASADVFVCLSSHEGFCVPLLEALRANVPIVALDAGAVGETVGDAGILLPRKSPSLVAEAIILAAEATDELSADQARQQRMEHHSVEQTRRRLTELVTDLQACS